MKHVAVIDSTGRGHALCDWFVRTSPAVVVHYLPGNALITHPRILSPINPIPLLDFEAMEAHLQPLDIDFIVVSHIESMSCGVVDYFRALGYQVVGADKATAQLECSKSFGRLFCQRHGIPSPQTLAQASAADILANCSRIQTPCVLKADGLRDVSDGAILCHDGADVEAAARFFISTGSATDLVIVEELVAGREYSCIAMVSESGYHLLPLVRDYKRTYEGDLGKNCDGMGSTLSPSDQDPQLLAELERVIFTPMIQGLAQEGLRLSGFLYVGVMCTADGPRVLEINVRCGDSEAEVLLPGITTSAHSVFAAMLDGSLDRLGIQMDGRSRCSVAAVQGVAGTKDSAGWPFGPFESGFEVSGLDADEPPTRVFLANIVKGPRGLPVTSGGRVLHVVGAGVTLAEAVAHAYLRLSGISFAGMRYRLDIGHAAGSQRTQ
ncbi:phosphoribosylglycinamide synthetase C domain-containing protein [Paucibacter sp. APW11]|uniref:phosphoribosylamine--glycine ligase n=1 Tax=Roseateles aquae TaxID=3077235 RepID=A0ABU3PAS3_9BURK|nr:phosphoribosylglycinamide synthetase C domain-containing protein [Paucibacter sp. APW11]MDT8999687.1 phosphoribosylglycinamide synthetase C domain-containing protein [Paucibacter sp. APW11]